MGIYNFITKDISAENETKRVIVSIRILYIIAFLAYVLDTAWAGLGAAKIFPYRTIAIPIFIIALFIHTYFSKTRPVVMLFRSEEHTSEWSSDVCSSDLMMKK